MRTVLTIAGSDCSGGAGIQADIKTITAHKMYAMSVITAMTAQNTTGVTAIQNSTPDFVAAQLDAVFTDIPPQAVKTGMLSTAEIIETIAAKLKQYQARNLVVDPVMVATSGSRLIAEEAVAALTQKLLPLALIVTPNLPEAEALTGMAVKTREDMVKAALEIKKRFAPQMVLVKGGHLTDEAADVLVENADNCAWFTGRRLDTPNTHGTGCTLSSAIACGLAAGLSPVEAVRCAKDYIQGALAAGLDLGRGNGPLNHCWAL